MIPVTPGVENLLVRADRFTYDEAGRMTTRDVAGVETDLTWDASSNLVATSGQGGDRVYLYDASGQRVAQLSVGDVDAPSPVAATVYFGATEATDADTATAGVVSATRFYAIGGATVATATAVTGSAPQWALLFGDVQGSASVSMELVADTGVSSGFEPASVSHEVVRDAYMPYGAARGDASDDLAIDRGWLGQYEDAGTGLTYLNARYYDPMLGRFLSPDPLMDPGDPRTLDPYRYADNNPISYTDATGLRPDCEGLSGKTLQGCRDGYKGTTGTYDPTPQPKKSKPKGNNSSTGSPPASPHYQPAPPPPVSPWTHGLPGSRAGVPDGLGYSDYQAGMAAGSDGDGWADLWRGWRLFINMGPSINGVYTWGTVLVAEANGGECGFSGQEAIMVCAQTPQWMWNGGGQMNAGVFITGAEDGEVALSLKEVLEQERLIAHEAKHGDQFAIFGAPLLGLLYYLGEDIRKEESELMGVNRCNGFESWADPIDGGYTKENGWSC